MNNELQVSPIIIGVMSGTSLDGLDIAACKFRYENDKWQYELLHAETLNYNEEMIALLQSAYNASGRELIQMHHQYGDFIGNAVKQYCKQFKIRAEYIASHGHTIFHQPNEGYTFQLGHGANIAAQSYLSTVCDFRTNDIALGGQGAPLVPIGDEWLFAEYDYCINLGGISNISFNENAIRKAYDIGICNMALNELAQLVGKAYDKDGEIAKSGQLDAELLLQLKQLTKSNNQSLGYEYYTQFFQPIIHHNPASVADKLHTICHFIAMQIAQECTANKSVLLTGGGAKNHYLVDLLKQHCKANITVPNTQLIDFKEALIFAFLGWLRILGKNNALANVTGASKDSCGGAIYLV